MDQQRTPIYISINGSYIPTSRITIENIDGVRSLIIGPSELWQGIISSDSINNDVDGDVIMN
jgi:hypothetical protein